MLPKKAKIYVISLIFIKFVLKNISQHTVVNIKIWFARAKLYNIFLYHLQNLVSESGHFSSVVESSDRWKIKILMQKLSSEILRLD